MQSTTRRCAWGAALLLTTVGIALACGFEFPQMLLGQRRATLHGMQPADWLAVQIEELLPQVADKLQANEGAGYLATEELEKRDANAAVIERLAAMRALRGGDAAYAAGEGLPEAVRLYTAGAVEFNAAGTARAAGENPAAHAAAALAFFQRVLELPPEQRAPRAIWASFMAGRTQRLSADAAAPELASRYFQQTRELARGGLPDPLGLAVASYGEEGRIALDAGDMPRALDLYLEQAARGSRSARDSLRFLARRLAADADVALRYIHDPRIQKLWFAQVVATGFDASYLTRPGGTGDPTGWTARVIKVTSAIDRTRTTQLDRLAAVAYATGRFDLAASLADGVDAPLAALVRAKLALRAGDRAAAAREYATAISRRSHAGASGTAGLSDRGWSRLFAENGVLAMSRDDYAAALGSLLEAGSEYWLDAAYVAERVLTLDELTGFAKQHVAAGTPPARNTAGDAHWGTSLGKPANPDKALRLLLARRQMREQRFDAALDNFRANDFALDEKRPSVAALAAAYAAAIHDSRERWTRVGRAQAAFEAARLAKQSGMELMGYELAPDFYSLGGMTTLDQRTDVDEYQGAEEADRINATAPPATRFHYRDVAYDLANRAADELPQRSQAFAAVLCANLRWAQSGNNMDHARALYGRYKREAAYVPWSTRFGERCEEPDFRRAAAFVWRARMHSARTALRPYKIPLEILAVVLVAGCAMLWWRRRVARR